MKNTVTDLNGDKKMELIDNFYSLYNSIEKVHDRYLYTYKKVGGKNVSVKKSFHEIHEDIHTAYSNLKNAGFKSMNSLL